MTTTLKYGNADNITVSTGDVNDVTFILGNGKDDSVGLVGVGVNVTSHSAMAMGMRLVWPLQRLLPLR
jgi:hypothetical protein